MSTSDPLRYFVDVGGQSYEVRELSGREKISAPYEFSVRFSVPVPDGLEPEEIVKGEVGIVLMRDDLLVRRIDGIITDASLGAMVRGVHEVELVIEPRLSLARYRTDIRVFRNMTVPEIVMDTL